MNAIPRVDSKGYFVEDVLFDHSSDMNMVIEKGNEILITTPVPPGLYHPRWDFDQSIWIEGLSTEEIAALQTPPTETSEQKIARLEQNDLDNKELIASLYEMVITSGGR